MPSWGSPVPGKSFVHSHSCPAPTSMGPNQVKRTRLELVDLVQPYTQQPCHPPLYSRAQWAHKPTKFEPLWPQSLLQADRQKVDMETIHVWFPLFQTPSTRHIFRQRRVYLVHQCSGPHQLPHPRRAAVQPPCSPRRGKSLTPRLRKAWMPLSKFHCGKQSM